MPISGINSFPLLPAAPQRVATERVAVERDRVERDRAEERRSTAPDLPDRSTLEPETLELSPQQRVSSSSRDENADFNPQPGQESLNFTAQRALKTFTENTPTPEQRLGIELAGIDTFA